MAQVDPYQIPIPQKWATDPELGPTVTYLWKFLHDLWTRTGAGYDAIANAAETTVNETITGAWIFSGAVDFMASVDFTGTVVFTGSTTVPAATVTAHQAALTILETQITDGSVLARVGANETISGAWTFSAAVVFGSTARLKNYTVATLPAAGTAGRIAYVTDANAPAFGAAVAGGGAVVTSVFDDGVNWITT